MRLQDFLNSDRALPASQLGQDFELAKQVQIRLKALGLLHGTVDGLVGQLTLGALSRFLRSHNLSTDKIDAAAAKALIEARSMPDVDLNLGYGAIATIRVVVMAYMPLESLLQG